MRKWLSQKYNILCANCRFTDENKRKKHEDRCALFAIFYKIPRLIAMPLKCAVNWEKSNVCSRVVPFNNQERSLAQKLVQTMHVVYIETSTWHSISISAILPRKLQLMNGNFQMDTAFSRTFALFMPISDRERREHAENTRRILLKWEITWDLSADRALKFNQGEVRVRKKVHARAHCRKS